MNHNTNHPNQHTYHPNLVRNEKLQFNLVLHEYQRDLNDIIQKHNDSTCIRNFTAILKQQPEIANSYNDPRLRVRHLNILVVLQNLKQLTQQTLHHTVYLFDLYCSKRVLYKRHYTLLFLTCLLVSCKYNDKKSKMPTIDELVKLANTRESLSPTTTRSGVYPNRTKQSQMSEDYCNSQQSNSMSESRNQNSNLMSEDNYNSQQSNLTSEDHSHGSLETDDHEEIDAQMFLQMEKHLLQTVNWTLAFWSIEETLQCICISLKQRMQAVSFHIQKQTSFDHFQAGNMNYRIPDVSSVNLKESDLLLLYQTASFLGEASYTIPEFNTLASDVVGYVSVLLAAKILETKGLTGFYSLLADSESDVNFESETVLLQHHFSHNQHHPAEIHTGDDDMMVEVTPTGNFRNEILESEVVEMPFPIKKLFNLDEESIYKCLHLFLNLLFDVDPVVNEKNRRYNIFLQKYTQIEILPLISAFQKANSKAYYKLIYLTNLEEESSEHVAGVSDSRLVREQIEHVSRYFLGLL